MIKISDVREQLEAEELAAKKRDAEESLAGGRQKSSQTMFLTLGMHLEQMQ